jgi:UDP-2,3-diacylglucosamine pyrophosphatase LpxH
VSQQKLEEMVETLGKDYESVIWISDLHIPYQDRKTLKATTKLIKDMQPDIIVLGGDIGDFYGVSQYDKNPKRANRMQKEVDEVISILEEITGISPNSRFIYLEGNHENRMQRYLWKNPELSDLRSLEVPNLLDLNRLGIEYRKDFMYKGFLFKHGDYVNKYSANKELEVEGVSGMSGHTHRNMMVSKTTRAGEMAWYGIGHLSDPVKAEYVDHANWQQGIAVVHFTKQGKRFHVTQIPIVDNKFLYNGKLYGER